MCGIVGFNWDDRILLKRMADKIAYRGPDDVAYYNDDKLSLGMRRLSIIDLTKGIYPLTNETEDIFMIFNGEIYNFQELKKSLLTKGHKFRTNGDGETIIHAYEEYGESFVDHLNGMFAIALYDSKKKQLFLVRDRLGVKPLYYYASDAGVSAADNIFHNKFMFASEIKSVLECEDVKRDVNIEALNTYLSLRYNPLEETFFKGIKRLLPGHILKFNMQHNTYTVRKYWDIADRFNARANVHPSNITEHDLRYYEDRLYSLLKDSVKKMLISDVPLGVYLSGGIDSSAIVAIMRELREEEHSDSGIFGLTLPMAMPARFTRLLVMNTTLATGELTEGFKAWRTYSNSQPDLAVGKLLRRGKREMDEAEAAGYDAPFPDATYKAALRAFPNLVPDGADAPGAAISREAQAFWQQRWVGDSCMAVGLQDPVLGGPTMAALRQSIRGCPPAMEVAEGGHFVPEWGAPIAHAALAHFGLARP